MEERPLTAEERAEIGDLIERVRARTGLAPISGRVRLQLEAIGGAIATRRDGGRLVAMAAVTGAPRDRRLAVAVDEDLDLAELGGPLVRDLLGGHAERLTWWVEGATDEHAALADALGMTSTRELLQLRRPLPVGEPWDLDVRAFRRGLDDRAWLEVNNRAFEGHPDQSGWQLHDLHARMAEPWFDPKGFLLHERDGRLAGFCWTKVHADTDPPLGEIYVIAVDPDFHGTGLGRPLTLAGLDHLARRGIEHGMLYVEHDNVAARHVYEDLGFAPHHRDRQYELAERQDVPPTPTAEPMT